MSTHDDQPEVGCSTATEDLSPDFSTILYFPLIRRWNTLKNGSDLQAQIEAICDSIRDPWKEITEPAELLAGHRTRGLVEDEPDTTYQVLCYFHEFIRRQVLNPGRNRDNPHWTCRVFGRSDIDSVNVRLGNDAGGDDIRLSVDKLQWWFPPFGTAILVVEVSKEGIPLDKLMMINHQIRRAFPSYFIKTEDLEQVPGAFPQWLSWCIGGKPIGPEPRSLGKEDFLEDNRTMTLAPWWEEMLPDIGNSVMGFKNEDGRLNQDVWSEPSDERMFLHFGLKFNDPHMLTPAELYRIGVVEAAALGNNRFSYPYAEDFCKTGSEISRLERHWNKGQEDKNALYLATDYSFVSIYKEDYIRDHVRKHYHVISLVVQIQKVQLLAFSQWISDAVRDLKADTPKEGDKFYDAVRQIRYYFAIFRNLYWFTGISPQIQGQEIYELVRGPSRIQEIFDDVAEEIESTESLLSLRAEHRAKRSAEFLEIVLAFLAVFGSIAALWAAPQWWHLFGLNPDKKHYLFSLMHLFVAFFLFAGFFALRPLFSSIVRIPAKIVRLFKG